VVKSSFFLRFLKDSLLVSVCTKRAIGNIFYEKEILKELSYEELPANRASKNTHFSELSIGTATTTSMIQQRNLAGKKLINTTKAIFLSSEEIHQLQKKMLRQKNITIRFLK
jgi:hypothetical protein